MNRQLRAKVQSRAGNRCEYCHVHQGTDLLASFHVEHVIARQHEGGDELDNLALACPVCNLHKGPNLTSIDPATGTTTSLFNPRLQDWNEHFVIRDGSVTGLTAAGRATVRLLRMNTHDRIEARVVSDELM